MTIRKQGIAIYDKNDFDPSKNFVTKEQTEVTKSPRTMIVEYSKDDHHKNLMTKHFCEYKCY